MIAALFLRFLCIQATLWILTLGADASTTTASSNTICAHIPANLQNYCERVLKAGAVDYKGHEIEGAIPTAGRHYFNTTTVFSRADALAPSLATKLGPVACFRIPSVVQTASGVVLAFTEARVNTCADCAQVGIAMKRSMDGGLTFQDAVWAVSPTAGGGANATVDFHRGANPTAWFDRARNRTVLHYVRGAIKGPTETKWRCIPGLANFQVTSSDAGASWSEPLDISAALGKWVGSLPGPGNGVQLQSGPFKGRSLVAAHFGTAERSTGAVIVYFSDDGDSWAVGQSAMAHMDESTLAEVGEGEVLLNMRNDPASTGQNTSCINGSCRAFARSMDGGATFSATQWDPALVDPICEGNIARYDANTTLFVNPAMRYSRSNLTLRLSTDSGSSWSRSVQLADIYALSDYTSIVHGPLLRGSSATIGVLWGSCTAPLPYRVWCLEDVVLGKLDPRAQWTVLFSRVPESSLLSAS